MEERLVHAALDGWAEYYLIVGAAAAALTGLQFVAQTLLAADLGRFEAGDPEVATAAFGSPTVVHFTLALVLSAVMGAPWPSLEGLRVTLAVLGAGAFLYCVIVLRRARSQRIYHPVLEDWVFHVVLPLIAYGAVLSAAFFLGDGEVRALFAVGAATLLLVIVGIHNAWDTVTYLTQDAIRRGVNAGEPTTPKPRAASGGRGRRRR
jgi:hypothetical protein